MKRISLVGSSLLLLGLLIAPGRSDAATASQIVRAADEGRMVPGELTFIATVKDFNQRKQIRLTRYRVYTKGRDASLVETIFPERQKGRKLLMEGDNLWLYTPDIKRPARVSMRQRLTGEVSNGDLARTNFEGDYEATLVRTEKLGGKNVYVLKLKAKRSSVTYSAIDYWVNASDHLPLKAVFYAASGKALKTAVYRAPKLIFGKKRVTQVVVQDSLSPGHMSMLTYSGHKRGSLPERIFSKEGMDE